MLVVPQGRNHAVRVSRMRLQTAERGRSMETPMYQQAPPPLSRNTDLRRYARECLKGNWAIMIAAFVLMGIITIAIMIPYYVATISTSILSVASGSSSDITPAFTPLYFLSIVALYLVSPALTIGSAMMCLRLIRARNADISDLFKGFRIILKAFGAAFMVGLFTLLWSLLLFIPGIIAAYRYSQVFYILADHPEMGIFDAIRLSKAMMAGAKFKLFCMQFSFIGWSLLSVLTLYIGMLWLVPYVSVSTSAFYEDVSRRYYFMTQPVQPQYNPNYTPNGY